MSAQPTPKARKHIEQKVSKGECLCCDKKMLKRGLCYQCHYKWRTKRLTLSSNTKRVMYDAKLIRIGRLLASQTIREYKSNSVFDRAAAEV